MKNKYQIEMVIIIVFYDDHLRRNNHLIVKKKKEDHSHISSWSRVIKSYAAAKFESFWMGMSIRRVLHLKWYSVSYPILIKYIACFLVLRHSKQHKCFFVWISHTQRYDCYLFFFFPFRLYANEPWSQTLIRLIIFGSNCRKFININERGISRTSKIST